MNKICLVAHLNDLSGANKALLDLAIGLSREYNLIVVVPRKGGLFETLEKNNIKTKVIMSGTWVYKRDEHFIKKIVKRILNVFAEKSFYRFFKKEGFDLIHYNSITYGCGARSAEKLGIPYIWHIRELAEENFNLTFFNKRKSMLIISHSTRILTISNFMYQKISGEFLHSTIDVVYDGKILNEKKRYENRRIDKLALIGAIAEDKGQLDAVRALNVLHKKGIMLDLYFVGLVTDDRYYKKVRETITADIEDNVFFVGYQSNLNEYRQQNYIALMCSPAEAFGLVTVEAMNAGQLIVGANGGATPEIIQDGFNGYLYTSGNYEELAQKIELVLNNPRKEQMIENAYNSIQAKFNVNTTVQSVNAIYREIINHATKAE